jgi:NADH dehydrogenase [ubiquinone] 1 alpha subcomplex assembly factor 6
MTKTSSLAIAKLNFWKESIENLYRGKISADPMSLCLNETLTKTNIPMNLFMKMINGRIQQVQNEKPRDIPHMILMAQEVHTPLLLMTLLLMRIDIINSPELLEVIESVAGAMGIVESLKMIPYDCRNEIERLPIDVSKRHNLMIKNIWNRHTGIPNKDLPDAILE